MKSTGYCFITFIQSYKDLKNIGLREFRRLTALKVRLFPSLRVIYIMLRSPTLNLLYYIHPIIQDLKNIGLREFRRRSTSSNV